MLEVLTPPLHERIHRHSRRGGDLWPRLKKDKALQWLPDTVTEFVPPARFAGRAAAQTREFLRRTVASILRLHRGALGLKVRLHV